MQATAKEMKYDREKVSRFKLCLDELIFDYRERVSSKTKSVDRFHKMIKEVEENIIRIRGGELTSTIQAKPEVYERLNL